MSEPDKLIAQKKELEQKIREIKNQNITVGRVMVGKETYPTDLPDRWYVAVTATYRNGTPKDALGRTMKRAIINGTSKTEVIDQIPDIIRDLQRLYDQEREAR